MRSPSEVWPSAKQKESGLVCCSGGTQRPFAQVRPFAQGQGRQATEGLETTQAWGKTSMAASASQIAASVKKGRGVGRDRCLRCRSIGVGLCSKGAAICGDGSIGILG